MTEILEHATYEALVEMMATDILKRRQPDMKYDHTWTQQVTVRTDDPFLPSYVRSDVGRAIDHHFSRNHPGWGSAVINVSDVTSKEHRLPSDRITNQELGAYHALAKPIFGTNAAARRIHRKAVIGREVVASSMTLQEFGDVMDDLRAFTR